MSPAVAGALERDKRLRTAPCLIQLPPLWDHHGHLAWLGAMLEQADLRGCRDLDEAIERLRMAGRELPRGAWLEGFGWDQNRWGGRYPDRKHLDALFPDRPVFLRRVDGHAAWVNSSALAMAGMDERTPDPPGGAMIREKGRPTGILLDTAMEALAAVVPAPASADLRRRLLAALTYLQGVGLSGATDMGLDPEHIAVLADLDRDGALPIPVEGFAWLRPAWTALPKPMRGVRFVLRGVKLFADGALGSRGGALWEPYTDRPGEKGFLLWDTDDMARALAAAASAGLESAVHAIGDRAVSQVLDAVERGAPCGGRIEHAQVVTDGDVARMAALHVRAGIQPCHYLSDRDWAGERLGPRMGSAYRWGSLLRAGVPLLVGSDFPIEEPNPGRNFAARAARREAIERLTPDQLIGAYGPPLDMIAMACPVLLACGAPDAVSRETDPSSLVFSRCAGLSSPC